MADSASRSLEELLAIIATQQDPSACDGTQQRLEELHLTPEDWRAMVAHSSFEGYVLFGKGLLRQLFAAVNQDAITGCVKSLLETSATVCPAWATFMLRGALSECRSLGSRRVAEAAGSIIFEAWLSTRGVEAATQRLMQGDSTLPEEAEAACLQCLSRFPDLISPLCALGPGREGAYYAQLAAALVAEWQQVVQRGGGISHSVTANLLVPMSLRGKAESLAVELCLTWLSASNAELSASCGRTLVAEIEKVDPGAACNLADGLLQACSCLLFIHKGELVAITDGSETNVLAVALSGSLQARGGALEYHLSDRVWRRQLGGLLSPAVIFALVDMLRASPLWTTTWQHWLERWADPSSLKASDIDMEKALALRIARGLARGESATQLTGSTLDLLLQGVHLRFGSHTEQSRGYGMAVVMLLAKTWPGIEGQSTPEELQFEGFDLTQLADGAFAVAGLEFESRPVSAEFACLCASEGQLSSEAAVLLHSRLKHMLSSDESGACTPSEPQSESPSAEEVGEAVETTAVKLQSSESKAVAAAPALETNEMSDSDDDDEDPLRHLPPLSPLGVPEDFRADLRLVQPPGFLRTGFEMLLGPPKVQSYAASASLQAEGGHSGPTAISQELPNVAHARLTVTLESLPGLVRRAGKADLQQLAKPLCDQILRMADKTGITGFDALRRAILASLLVVDVSRAVALPALLVDFGSSELHLATRILILESLVDAAKELSGAVKAKPPALVSASPSSQEQSAVAAVKSAAREAANLQKDDPSSGRTRRFASATKVDDNSKLNLFAALLKPFFFPLIARWRQPEDGAARGAMQHPMLLSSLLKTAGSMLECAGSACPDRQSSTQEALLLVQETFEHAEAQVRRCSIFLLSRVLLVHGGSMLLTQQQDLPERLRGRVLYEGDDVCRKMLAGVLAWLAQEEQRALASGRLLSSWQAS